MAGGINTYAYVNGNLISNGDSLGLWTLQVGIGVSGTMFGYSVSVTGGVAIDSKGGVGVYGELGGGPAAGAGISGGLVLHGSNGNAIADLNGPFSNVNAGYGAGVDVTGDGFYGYGVNGQRVEGGGITIGAGIGGGAAATLTGTYVVPLIPSSPNGPGGVSCN